MTATNETWVFPDWPVPPGVHARVTTRHGPGISQPPFGRFNLSLGSGEDEHRVRRNRGALRKMLALPAEPCWLRQVHGATVVSVPSSSSLCEPEADAAVSHLPGTVLVIQSADCLPVLFCAEDGSAIGAAHAGWRGLAAGVLEKTIAHMRRPPLRLLAWLGPCIGASSYEVGEEVRQAFLTHDPMAASAFAPKRLGRFTCDLAVLARQRLVAAGLVRIYGGGFDTRNDPRFYSYRREGARSGRFASLIWRKA